MGVAGTAAASGAAGVASGKGGKSRKAMGLDGAGCIRGRVGSGSREIGGRAAISVGFPGGVPGPDFSTKAIRSENSSRERPVCRPSGMRDIWLIFRFLILDFSRKFVTPRLSINMTVSVVSERTIPAKSSSSVM